jgi:hypothetical protein
MIFICSMIEPGHPWFGLFLGTSQLRVTPYEFLLGTQPIFDVVAILLAT